MNDWLDIGVTPSCEDCAQVGTDSYPTQARRECRAYINLLRRVLGPEPPGARLDIRSNPHDFGDYLSVVCYYDKDKPDATDYAFRCESKNIDLWDAEARRELGLPEEGAP